VKEPEVKVAQNLLSLKGTIIGTSDIVRALQNQQQTNINRIDVFGLNTLFIDEDITSHGSSMHLLAPQWKVVGSRFINLSGNNGIHAPRELAPEGVDVQPGTFGSHGGHIFGKGRQFSNMSHLTISTNGGNGQNGGEGHDGRNGDDGSLKSVRAEYYYRDTVPDVKWGNRAPWTTSRKGYREF
jgi:hypothetical protein